MGGFAGVALVLAALGLYGVLSYAVAQRRRELGVRSALGADAGELTRLVVGGGVRLAAVGAGVGLLLYAGAQRALGALLYGVGASDPVALAAGVGAITAAALVASWIPARRAARVDPAVTLRAE
jgi:ABC-type antimicrobial peptide transport system permease subunit